MVFSRFLLTVVRASGWTREPLAAKDVKLLASLRVEKKPPAWRPDGQIDPLWRER